MVVNNEFRKGLFELFFIVIIIIIFILLCVVIYGNAWQFESHKFHDGSVRIYIYVYIYVCVYNMKRATLRSQSGSEYYY